MREEASALPGTHHCWMTARANYGNTSAAEIVAPGSAAISSVSLGERSLMSV
jgi:hypothetical protein